MFGRGRVLIEAAYRFRYVPISFLKMNERVKYRWLWLAGGSVFGYVFERFLINLQK